jgi:hypothetical protein
MTSIRHKSFFTHPSLALIRGEPIIKGPIRRVPGPLLSSCRLEDCCITTGLHGLIIPHFHIIIIITKPLTLLSFRLHLSISLRLVLSPPLFGTIPVVQDALVHQDP